MMVHCFYRKETKYFSEEKEQSKTCMYSTMTLVLRGNVPKK